MDDLLGGELIDIDAQGRQIAIKDVALTVNSRDTFNTTDPAKYHVVSGKNDGMAKFAIPDAADAGEGPLFANAGTFYCHLDVVSVSLAQHF